MFVVRGKGTESQQVAQKCLFKKKSRKASEKSKESARFANEKTGRDQFDVWRHGDFERKKYVETSDRAEIVSHTIESAIEGYLGIFSGDVYSGDRKPFRMFPRRKKGAFFFFFFLFLLFVFRVE